MRQASERKLNWKKEEQKNCVRVNLGDLEEIDQVIAEGGMKLIFIVWNWQKLQLGHKEKYWKIEKITTTWTLTLEEIW